MPFEKHESSLLLDRLLIVTFVSSFCVFFHCLVAVDSIFVKFVLFFYVFFLLQLFRPPRDDIDFDNIYRYVDSFPSIDPPEIFGLHANANIEHLKQDSRKIIDYLVTMQPRAMTFVEYVFFLWCQLIIDSISLKCI